MIEWIEIKYKCKLPEPWNQNVLIWTPYIREDNEKNLGYPAVVYLLIQNNSVGWHCPNNNKIFEFDYPTHWAPVSLPEEKPIIDWINIEPGCKMPETSNFAYNKDYRKSISRKILILVDGEINVGTYGKDSWGEKWFNACGYAIENKNITHWAPVNKPK